MAQLIEFNKDVYLEGTDLQERFGLRGRNVMQLAQLKAPIAPGFMIDSSTLTGGKVKNLTRAEIEKAVKKIESLTGKTFNKADRPMFFKVVISPSIQIGSLRSVHTVGISDVTVQGFAKYSGESFAYDEYRHYLESYGSRFMGVSSSEFKKIKDENPKASPKEICALYRDKVVPGFPQDGYDQLLTVLTNLAEQYLSDEMNEGIEAGVLIQMMVYGNFGKNSYSGSYFTRNIVTGEAQLTGYFARNQFDSRPDTGEDINKIGPKHLKVLKDFATQLEEKFLDIRQVKFTIEEDRLWVIEQDPVDTKSTQAEVRTFLDLHKKGLITRKKLVEAIPPAQIQDLLHPVIDVKSTRSMVKLVGGIAGSPGAAVGRVAFSTEKLMKEYHRCTLAGINSNLILVRPHTDAEDVQSIEVGRAVIASVGGYASHAPVVARSLRKPCLVKENIEYKKDHILVEGHRINEFDVVSLEVPTYTDPSMWIGEAKMVYPDTAQNGLEEYIGEVGEFVKDFQVMAIAESDRDIEVALSLGATGIGLLSMDGMLNHEATHDSFVEALLTKEPEQRKKSLKNVEGKLIKRIVEIFKRVGGRKIIFLMQDKPLYEFLPHSEKEMEEVYGKISGKMGVSLSELKARAGQLRNINPMMGLRGSRIAISYPDLYEMQFEAILRAAMQYSDGKAGKVNFDLMVPAVMTDAEMRFIRTGRNIEGIIIRGFLGVESDLLEEWKMTSLPFQYKIGAMIELPAAALMAGHMAKQSEFFSIGTHTLTQTTNGMSHDDINMFLPSYTQYDILRDNPFQILSSPVKHLIAMAKDFGKVTRPDIQVGLCGSHASDPLNIKFAFEANLNFVTCNPYGVPIAKLAVAQIVAKNQPG
ncbi:MAG: PEP-utilizing enzyme [Deltaproteobacteria bacterium]|nr:PEP-utilizing enzyme [Deltaproteobacteria bacterium]